MYTCHHPIGIKYLSRLRLEFSHLLYHKFKHGFLDAVDLLCICSSAIENTVHYFLHFPNFSTVRNTFLNEIAIADGSIIGQDKIKILNNFLCGNPTYSVNDSRLITSHLAYVINNAGKSRRSLIEILLDLHNAFGEVHHNLIDCILEYYHVPGHVSEIVKNLYCCFKTSILNDRFVTFIQFVEHEQYEQFGYQFMRYLTPLHWYQFADYAAVLSGLESEN